MKSQNNNINSLLDTLTNVISILIIVFAVTYVIVTEATNRINQSGYTAKEINKRSLQEKEATLKQIKLEYKTILQDKVQRLRAELSNDTVSELALQENISDDFSAIEEKLDHMKTSLNNSEYARMSTTDIDSKIDELKTTISQYEQIISEYGQAKKIPNKTILSTGINNTPLREANFVRLPDPKPAPESAKPIFWVCRYGKIAEVPFDRLSELFLDEVRRTFKYSDNSYRRVANLVNYFDTNRVGTDQFFWQVVPVLGDNQLKRLFLSLKWENDVGETPEMIASGQSFFRHRLQSLKDEKEEFYFHFQVWDDSFDVYLLAREIASQQGINAGWAIYEKNELFMVQQLWPTNQTEMDSSTEVKLAID